MVLNYSLIEILTKIYYFFFLLDKPTIQNFGKKNYITKNVSTGSKRCKKKKKNIDTGIENIRS